MKGDERQVRRDWAQSRETSGIPYRDGRIFPFRVQRGAHSTPSQPLGGHAKTVHLSQTGMQDKICPCTPYYELTS